MFVDTGYFQAHSWAEPRGALSPFPGPLRTAWPRATPAPRQGGQQTGNFGYNRAQPSPISHPAPNVMPPHISTSFPAAFPCSFLLPGDLPSATFPWSRQPGALKWPQAGGGTCPRHPITAGRGSQSGGPTRKAGGHRRPDPSPLPPGQGGVLQGAGSGGCQPPSHRPAHLGASRGSPGLHPPAWQRPIRGGRAVALATPRCHSGGGWRRRGCGWWQRGQRRPVGRERWAGGGDVGLDAQSPPGGRQQARGPLLGQSEPSPQPTG